MNEDKAKIMKIIRWNKHWLYRLLKFLYGAFFGIGSIAWLIFGRTESSSNQDFFPTAIISVLSIAIVFTIIKKIFYYVVFGTLSPRRDLKKTNFNDVDLDKHISHKEWSKNGDGFKLVIIGVVFIIVVVLIRQFTKTEFDACYDKCRNVYRNYRPSVDGTCGTKMHKVNNKCVVNPSTCWSACKK
jgi:hypothetical protein